MPVNAAQFRAALRPGARGVAIVTARAGRARPRDDGLRLRERVARAAARPVCADKTSNTLGVIEAGGIFAVNILAPGSTRSRTASPRRWTSTALRGRSRGGAAPPARRSSKARSRARLPRRRRARCRRPRDLRRAGRGGGARAEASRSCTSAARTASLARRASLMRAPLRARRLVRLSLPVVLPRLCARSARRSAELGAALELEWRAFLLRRAARRAGAASSRASCSTRSRGCGRRRSRTRRAFRVWESDGRAAFAQRAGRTSRRRPRAARPRRVRARCTRACCAPTSRRAATSAARDDAARALGRARPRPTRLRARLDDPALLRETLAEHDEALDAGATGVPAAMLAGHDAVLRRRAAARRRIGAGSKACALGWLMKRPPTIASGSTAASPW